MMALLQCLQVARTLRPRSLASGTEYCAGQDGQAMITTDNYPTPFPTLATFDSHGARAYMWAAAAGRSGASTVSLPGAMRFEAGQMSGPARLRFD